MTVMLGGTSILGSTSILGTTSPSPLWYLTRGTGAVVLVLLTASVVIGVASSARWGSVRWPRFVVGGLHRNISLLAMVLLAIHIVTSVTDTFARIRWIDAVVPFVASYRPLWLGLGTLTFDLMIALVVTSFLRQRLGYRTWKGIHWLAYASWPVAVLHSLGTGSDATSAWLLILTALCTLAVVAAVWWRVAAGWPSHWRVRVGAVAASVLAPVAGVIWLAVGPLQAGWARRAGTPAPVLARVAAPAAGTGAASGSAPQSAASPSGGTSTVPSASFPTHFSAQMQGTVSQGRPAADGTVAVTVRTTLSGGASGSLEMVLRGQPAEGGGVAVSTSQVTLGPTSNPHQYQGSVVSLEGGRVTVALSSSTGSALDVSLRLRVDNAAGTVTGTAQGAPASSSGNPAAGGGQ